MSLGKVETELKTCPLVENICVYGDAGEAFVVALVVPDRNKVVELAEGLGLSHLTFEAACADPEIRTTVLKAVVKHGKDACLEKFELPGAVTLCTEQWTPESGLVTAAFKLKRKPIQEYYQKELDRMYGHRQG